MPPTAALGVDDEVKLESMSRHPRETGAGIRRGDQPDPTHL